ncbi:MAG: M48 family metalloprotease [Planctomycetota bacterium]
MAIDLAKELEGSGHPDAPRPPREEPKAFKGMQKAFGVTFRDLQRRNRRRAFVLAGTLVLLLGALGASLGSIWGAWPIGLAIGVVIALVQFAVARQGGPTIVMKALGAHRLGPTEDPQLRNVVEEMAIAAGLPCPEVWVVPEDSPNAFATGFRPDRSAIAVTSACASASAGTSCRPSSPTRWATSGTATRATWS